MYFGVKKVKVRMPEKPKKQWWLIIVLKSCMHGKERMIIREGRK